MTRKNVPSSGVNKLALSWKKKAKARQKLLDKGVTVGEVVDMGSAETCNFADPEGHYFAFKSVKA